MATEFTYSAFAGNRLVASGNLTAMLRKTKSYLDRAEDPRVLIFEDQTGQQIDFNFHGTLSEVLERATKVAEPAAGVSERVGPGRPKLGVVSREVSLLPRHWEWLESEPNGISAALRRLVDDAKKKNPGEQRTRRALEAISRFMTAMAGNLEHFEEATRALFGRDTPRLQALISAWPKDIRAHVLGLLADSSASE